MQSFEQQIDIETFTTSYDQYLDSGGKFSEQEFQLTQALLYDDSHNVPFNIPCARQILNIGETCDFEVTMPELLTYIVLRDKMPCKDDHLEPNSKIKHACDMMDQELACQIFLLSDPTREKYQRITSQYPYLL